MEGTREVDPSGDVIIILRNPGAPFAEAATEAEIADEGRPPVADDLDSWSGWPSISKKKKDKKKKKKRITIAEREEAATGIEPVLVVEAAAIAEVLAVNEAPGTAETPAEEVVTFEEGPTDEGSPIEDGGRATEAKSVVEAELVADADGSLGGGSSKQGESRSLSEASGIRLRVSSRHLVLASPYFKAALDGSWAEATSVSADGYRHIFADDWDPEAFLILMHIFHGRNRQVPRLVSLELLANIAALVDYYNCHEAVEVFAGLWLQELKILGQLPSKVGRDLILWLFISWVFEDTEVFTSVTSTALQKSQGPVPTLGLPIPGSIIDTIDRRRQEIVDKIITVLHGLLVSFRDDPEKCSFECSSIQFGALTKEMRAKRFEPRPESPMLGYSVEATMAAARSIRSPRWSTPGTSSYSMHPCNLQNRVCQEVDALKEMVGGLALSEF